MAVDWGEMAKTELSGASWEESIALFKLSNVLGFNLSNVLGFYFSNYGFMKTQLMLGLERKINLAPKYEWYYTAPTKVLVAGENKIDIGDYKKVTPYDWKTALKRVFTTSQDQITAFTRELKAANKAETIAGPSSTTCMGHTLQVNALNSEETIALGTKTIKAPTGGITLEAPMINLTGVTGNSIALGMGGLMTITGTTINIG